MDCAEEVIASEVEQQLGQTQCEDLSSPLVVIEGLGDVPIQPPELSVAASCAFESVTRGFPLYLIPVDAESEPSLAAALAAYMNGTDGEALAAGYVTTLAADGANYIAGASVDGGEAVVSLRASIVELPSSGGTAFRDQLVAELAATAMPYAESVLFELDGSCSAFIEFMEIGGSCGDLIDRGGNRVERGSLR